MPCPKCGSDNIQFTTTPKSTGFSFFDSCCGYILIGPLGLLFGLCGIKLKSDEFWICNNCGNKFSPEEATKSFENAQDRASTYRDYKLQLEFAEQTEGDYQAIRFKHIAAKEKLKNAEDASRNVLEEIKGSSDELQRKKAKKVAKTSLNVSSTTLVVLGFLLLFAYLPAGIVTIVLGGILELFWDYRKEKASKWLRTVSPEYDSTEAIVDEASKEEKRLAALVEKIDFVEKYERMEK